MTAAEQSQLNTPNLLLHSVIIVKTRMFANANHDVSTSLDFHFLLGSFQCIWHNSYLFNIKTVCFLEGKM